MSHSVPDLRAYLSGVWTVERTLVDRSTGLRGAFSGTVTFRPRDEADDDGALLQCENGRLRWAQHDGPATREYVWRAGASPETMDVFFPDGRFFHRVSLSSDSPSTRGEHWCDPDDYRVSYTVLGPDEFRYEWDVKGPAKDLLLTSVLRRSRG